MCLCLSFPYKLPLYLSTSIRAWNGIVFYETFRSKNVLLNVCVLKCALSLSLSVCVVQAHFAICVFMDAWTAFFLSLFVDFPFFFRHFVFEKCLLNFIWIAYSVLCCCWMKYEFWKWTNELTQKSRKRTLSLFQDAPNN